MNEHMNSIVESIDAIAKQRDELRRQLEERTETLSVARVNMFQAEQDARKAERERDEALAALKVSDEGRVAAIRMMDAWKDKADKADEALEELREAVRALLKAMPLDMTTCPKCRGNILATKVCRFEPPFAGSWFACDEHATPGAMDMRTAPHVRRLRALVEPAG